MAEQAFDSPLLAQFSNYYYSDRSDCRFRRPRALNHVPHQQYPLPNSQVCGMSRPHGNPGVVVQQPGYANQPGYPQPGYANQAGYGGPPVPQNLPAQQTWMTPPAAPPGCPPGLEYLTLIDQVIVKQKVELLEAFTGFETNNKYLITNSVGQQVFFAAEDTDCCTRQCCGASRPFEIKIMDNTQREVLHLSRPFRCTGCCFPCFLQELEVCGPPGQVLGYVIQKWSLCAPRFEITDASRNPVLLMEGPICTFNFCGDVEFRVLSLDGANQVGRVSKQWMGLVKEAFTDADTFGITFPMDLDVKVKAVMIGAAFLIDFMFFEKTGDKNNRLTIN